MHVDFIAPRVLLSVKKNEKRPRIISCFPLTHKHELTYAEAV